MDHSVISDKSTFEERQKNLGPLRKLYSCFWFENTVAMLWILLCNYWSHDLGNWVENNFWLAICTGVISLILLFSVAFSSKTRVSPVNWIVYLTFTVTWMYTMGYFSVLDSSKTFVYIYALIWGVSTAFLFQSIMSSTYMSTLTAIVWILLSTFIIFQIFIIWTNIKLAYLAIWLAVVWVFAFYLSQDVRTMVRHNA